MRYCGGTALRSFKIGPSCTDHITGVHGDKVTYNYLEDILKVKEMNSLKTKRRLLYLKTQFVPRSKHFSSHL